MVFSSIQAYLDPSNWQQHPPGDNYETGATSGAYNTQHLPQPPPPPPPAVPPHGGSGSIRPGSMADRARLANIPMPEAALKCPRCESTNTKFCYFNNYSLSQPRHFCKTCRRYWTRGGALRNVPVGGGCRRNKRNKSTCTSTNNTNPNSSKSQGNTMGHPSTISAILTSNNYITHHDNILSQVMPSIRFASPASHQLSEFTNTADNMGFNSYNAVSSHELSAFQMGSGSVFNALEQWRSQPSFLGGNNLDSSNSSGFYPFESGIEESGYVRPKQTSSTSSSGLAAQLGLVKVEENSIKWTDPFNFSSSSAGNPL